MIRKIAFALVLVFQFSVVANLASAYSPHPTCYPCPNVR
jgi:hypothetical protein